MKTFQTEGEQLVSDLTNLLKRLHEKIICRLHINSYKTEISEIILFSKFHIKP